MAILAKSYKEDRPAINGIPNEYPVGSGVIKTEVKAMVIGSGLQKGEAAYIRKYANGPYYQVGKPNDFAINRINAIALSSGKSNQTIRVIPLEKIK